MLLKMPNTTLGEDFFWRRQIVLIIVMLFDYRQEADYDLDADITVEEAQNLIKAVKECYNLSKDYLFKLLSGPQA